MTDYTKLSNAHLGAKVAEEVMGWKSVPSPSGDYVRWEDENGKRHTTWCAAESFRGLLCWLPAERLADAMEIWKKLKADGFDMFSLNEGAAGWWCVLYPRQGKSARGVHCFESHFTDEPGRAVCCAALDYAALRAKEKTDRRGSRCPRPGLTRDAKG